MTMATAAAKKKKKTWITLGVLGLTLASAYVKPKLFEDIRQVISVIFASDSVDGGQ